MWILPQVHYIEEGSTLNRSRKNYHNDVLSQKSRRNKSQKNQISQTLSTIVYKDGCHQVLPFLYTEATPPLKDRAYFLASSI